MFTLHSLLQNVLRPAGCLAVLVAAILAVRICGGSQDGLTGHEQSWIGDQAVLDEGDGLEEGKTTTKGKTAAVAAIRKAADAALAAVGEIQIEAGTGQAGAGGGQTGAGTGQAGAGGEQTGAGTGQAGVDGGQTGAGTGRAGAGGKQMRASARRIVPGKTLSAGKEQPAADAEPAGKDREEGEKSSRIAYDQQDYEVMLKIVQAEAGGCDSTGKILVANVIMNRVEDSGFPDDITSVVYERAQFSPVSSGAIDQVQVTKETVDCVDRALNGEDHSQGALYFMNRQASGAGNAQWFDKKLTFLFSHDGHEFFK